MAEKVKDASVNIETKNTNKKPKSTKEHVSFDPQKYKGLAISFGAIIALLTIAFVTVYAVVRMPTKYMKDIALVVIPSLISVTSYVWGKKHGSGE